MATIDFQDISEAIATILRADAGLSGVVVEVEPDVVGYADEVAANGWVGIYAGDSVANDEDQVVAAGTQENFRHLVEVHVAGFHAENARLAKQVRDDKARLVYAALRSDLTWGGEVEWSRTAEIQRDDGANNRNQRISVQVFVLECWVEATT